MYLQLFKERQMVTGCLFIANKYPVDLVDCFQFNFQEFGEYRY